MMLAESADAGEANQIFDYHVRDHLSGKPGQIHVHTKASS